MKTKSLATSSFIRRATTTLATVALAFGGLAQTASADIPDVPNGKFAGMYKVASSNDPIFPMASSEEWFLDFGKGMSQGRTSGNVAVSLRRNPDVKVRIMAWQYFPEKGALVIGNPYSEGSKQAVARGVWQMEPVSRGVMFQRGNYQVVLRPADPGDY